LISRANWLAWYLLVTVISVAAIVIIPRWFSTRKASQEFPKRNFLIFCSVVISGGEPSLRSALEDFIREIKSRKFQVKLDTNGTNASRTMQICVDHGIDAFGIDYKAPVAKYPHVTNCTDENIAQNVHDLIGFAVTNKIQTDVRTTVHRSLLSPEDLHIMRDELDELGQEDWVLQQFHPADIIDESLLEEPTYTDRELLELAENLGGGTRVRGLKGILLQ
jgi:pyruvate formate lyase activating enzyme